jgi:hypothetical protein
MEVPVRGRKSKLIVLLTTEQRELLEYWRRCTTLPAGLARRARAMLLLAERRTFTEVQRLTGMRRRHLRKWVKRFLELGPDGLRDGKRPGRKPVFSPSGGDASGEDGLRTARSRRAFAVAVGL